MKGWHHVPMLCKQRSQKEKQGKYNRLKRGNFFNFNNAVSTCLKYIFVLKISINRFNFLQMKVVQFEFTITAKSQVLLIFPFM